MDVRPHADDEQSLVDELKSSALLFAMALACTAGVAAVSRFALGLVG